MAKEISKTNRVFFIDNPFTLKDILFKLRSKAIFRRLAALLFGKKLYSRGGNLPTNLTIVTPRMTWPINFLPAGIIYNFFSEINNRLVCEAIAKCLIDHNIKGYVYINSYNPFYWLNLKIVTPPQFSIYQCVDNIAEQPYISKHGPRLEVGVISRSDLVLVTSKELYKIKAKLTRAIEYLPNAADFSIFSKSVDLRDWPKDVPRSYKKIIGYTGNIDPRLDYELLCQVAAHFPEFLVLIIGPKTFDEYRKKGLNDYKNVLFLGSRPYESLPFYLFTFDCAIIPFKCNEATKSIYPLKINEYLASGKPVVASNFSEDICTFKQVISIASSSDEFMAMIAQEIENDTNEKRDRRISVASGNTWEARRVQFWNILAKYGLKN